MCAYLLKKKREEGVIEFKSQIQKSEYYLFREMKAVQSFQDPRAASNAELKSQACSVLLIVNLSITRDA